MPRQPFLLPPPTADPSTTSPDPAATAPPRRKHRAHTPAQPTGPALWGAPDLLFADDDPAQWAALYAALQRSLAPRDALQDVLVGRITSLVWRLRRLQRTEAGLRSLGLARSARARRTSAIYQKLVGDTLPPAEPPSAGLLEAQSWLHLSHQPDAWAALQRAEAALERSLYRALATLTSCQSRS